MTSVLEKRPQAMVIGRIRSGGRPHVHVLPTGTDVPKLVAELERRRRLTAARQRRSVALAKQRERLRIAVTEIEYGEAVLDLAARLGYPVETPAQIEISLTKLLRRLADASGWCGHCLDMLRAHEDHRP